MAVLSWQQVAAVAIKAGFPAWPRGDRGSDHRTGIGRNATIVQQGMP